MMITQISGGGAAALRGEGEPGRGEAERRDAPDGRLPEVGRGGD